MRLGWIITPIHNFRTGILAKSKLCIRAANARDLSGKRDPGRGIKRRIVEDGGLDVAEEGDCRSPGIVNNRVVIAHPCGPARGDTCARSREVVVDHDDLAIDGNGEYCNSECDAYSQNW